MRIALLLLAGVFGGGILAGIVLAVLDKLGFQSAEPANTITNGALLGGLVAITWWYARSTSAIAARTQEQAEASRRLAEEAEKTRFDSLRPLLVLHPEQPSPGFPGSTTDLADLLIPLQRNPYLRVTNLGVGPAVENAVHLVRLQSVTTTDHKAVLGPQGIRPTYLLSPLQAGGTTERLVSALSTGDSNDYYVLLTFIDIFGRHFCTRYRIIPRHEGGIPTGHQFSPPDILGPRTYTYDP